VSRTVVKPEYICDYCSFVNEGGMDTCEYCGGNFCNEHLHPDFHECLDNPDKLKKEVNQMATKKKNKKAVVAAPAPKKVEKKRGRQADPELKKLKESGDTVNIIVPLSTKIAGRAKVLALAKNRTLAVLVNELVTKWTMDPKNKKAIADMILGDANEDEEDTSEEESDNDNDSEDEEDSDDEESDDDEDSDDEDSDDEDDDDSDDEDDDD